MCQASELTHTHMHTHPHTKGNLQSVVLMNIQDIPTNKSKQTLEKSRHLILLLIVIHKLKTSHYQFNCNMKILQLNSMPCTKYCTQAETQISQKL